MPDQKISELSAAAAALLTHEFAAYESVGVEVRVSALQLAELLFKKIAGNSGAAGPYTTLQHLTSNSADNATVTPVVVMTTTGVGVGVWKFRYLLIFQTAATGTGIGICVNHTGTVGQFTSHSHFVSSGAAAATGVSDGVSAANAGQMVEGKSERVHNTISSATAGVDTANADCQIEIAGFIEVTATGSLELKIASEVAASAVRLIALSNLELTKVA